MKCQANIEKKITFQFFTLKYFYQNLEILLFSVLMGKYLCHECRKKKAKALAMSTFAV